MGGCISGWWVSLGVYASLYTLSGRPSAHPSLSSGVNSGRLKEASRVLFPFHCWVRKGGPACAVPFGTLLINLRYDHGAKAQRLEYHFITKVPKGTAPRVLPMTNSETGITVNNGERRPP